MSDRDVTILGVRLTNVTRNEAVSLLERLFQDSDEPSRAVYIVNAHSLNLCAESDDYRSILRRAHTVFGDGTGVRWAARMRHVRMRGNLVGTDLVPELLRKTANRGYRYYLLGADAEAIQRAADYCRRQFPGWELAGAHHGYVDGPITSAVIGRINAAKPQLLLVGMGNPKQEHWIDRNRSSLDVPVCIGVGGLFDHWAGNLRRAPLWVRRLGFEWLQILLQQPKKWRRYVLGNPLFLWRAVRQLRKDLRTAPGERVDSSPAS